VAADNTENPLPSRRGPAVMGQRRAGEREREREREREGGDRGAAPEGDYAEYMGL